jgi:hypothetical protein
MGLLHLYLSLINSAVVVTVVYRRMLGLLASNELIRTGKEVQSRDLLEGVEESNENFVRLDGLAP